MFKKTMIAAMAIAVVAAFGATTSASASAWKHHATAIQQDKNITLTGQAKFSGGIGSTECQTTSTLQLTSGAGAGTGHVKKFQPDLDEAGSTVTTKCHATGLLAPCQIHAAQPTGTGGANLEAFPWLVHNETQVVEITSGEIHLSLTGGFCGANEVHLTATNAAKQHTVTATPTPGPHTVQGFTLSGQLEAHVTLKNSSQSTETVQISGTQTITEGAEHPDSKSGTYSLT